MLTLADPKCETNMTSKNEKKLFWRANLASSRSRFLMAQQQGTNYMGGFLLSCAIPSQSGLLDLTCPRCLDIVNNLDHARPSAALTEALSGTCGLTGLVMHAVSFIK